nr:LysR family transcriptional regulator [Planococcus salinarum]
MDIRQLTCFVEVAKHKSFTKASQTMHVTQPSLSKMVKNLEQDWTLFYSIVQPEKSVLRMLEKSFISKPRKSFTAWTIFLPPFTM